MIIVTPSSKYFIDLNTQMLSGGNVEKFFKKKQIKIRPLAIVPKVGDQMELIIDDHEFNDDCIRISQVIEVIE